jgi:DNA-binding NtrC family response regulator
MSVSYIKVLLIEDNPIHTRLIERLLAKASGQEFDVTSVDQLSVGLVKLAQEEFDVVLLDMVLPDSQGIDTLSSVKAEAPNLPIVILTATDDMTLATQAVEEGAQAYLVKAKINCDMLESTIGAALQRAQSENAE